MARITKLSYLPQAAPLFELLGIRAPRVALRPQILVVEERQHKNLLGSGVELADLLDPAFDLDARLAPVEDTEFVSEATQKLESLVEELLQPSLKLDTNLERPWQKTAEQMRRALEVYGNKVQAAAARRDETARARVESLRTSFFPGGALQERVIASSHFPGKYGDRFVAAMFEQMRLDPTTLHVVTP